MEKLNVYSPISSSIVSEPYGLSEFHKWVIPQILRDTEGEFSPISSSLEEINRIETILSESKYWDEDKEFLNEKVQQWKEVYIPPGGDGRTPDNNIYQIVPKQFKKSIYEG